MGDDLQGKYNEIYDSSINQKENFWKNIVNWDFMIEKGVISKSDIDFFKFCNSVDSAFKYLTEKITSTHLKGANF